MLQQKVQAYHVWRLLSRGRGHLKWHGHSSVLLFVLKHNYRPAVQRFIAGLIIKSWNNLDSKARNGGLQHLVMISKMQSLL